MDACMLAVQPLRWRTFDLKTNDQAFGYGFQAELPEADLLIDGSSQSLKLIFRPRQQHTEESNRLLTELLRAFFDITKARRVVRIQFTSNAQLKSEELTSVTYFEQFYREEHPKDVTFGCKIQFGSTKEIRLKRAVEQYKIHAGTEPSMAGDDTIFFNLFFDAPLVKDSGAKAIQDAVEVTKKLLQTEKLCLQYLGLKLYAQES